MAYRPQKAGACIVKSFALIMLFLVCALSGFSIARLYVRRTEELRQLRGALSFLETEITYGTTPLHEALRQIGEREAGPVGLFFSRVAERLCKKDGTSAFDCWQNVLFRMKTELSLLERDRHIMLRLGQKLGLSDKGDQLHHLRLAQANLEIEEAQAMKEQEKYEKMCRSLGVLVGALLVILLY